MNYMEIALSIAALIVAVAVAVLVFYLARTLKSTERTLDNVADTLESFEKQLEGITTETTTLLNKTNRLAEDIEQKSAKLNTVFDGINEIGVTIQGFNQSVKDLSSNISKAASVEDDRASQAVKWGAALIDLWKRKRQ